MPKAELLPFEKVAAVIAARAAEEGWIRAECAMDKSHPCLVIWSESAVEHLGAFLHAMHKKSYERGAVGGLLALSIVAADMPGQKIGKDEILKVGAEFINGREA
jgi:hypothetical protein